MVCKDLNTGNTHMNLQDVLKMQNKWISHAALKLDCATQNDHSSLNEARSKETWRSETGTSWKLLHVSVPVHSMSDMTCMLCWLQKWELGWQESLFEGGSGLTTSSSSLEFVDVEGEFEGGAKFQTHVFHHHIAAQQQEGFTVNILKEKEKQIFIIYLFRKIYLFKLHLKV